LNLPGKGDRVSSMSILVTGAAGFIGSHLSEALIAAGHLVYGLDNFDPYYPRTIKEQNLASLLGDTRFRLYEGDICERADVDHLFAEAAGHGQPVTAVVHLAAKAGVRPSIADPVGYAHTNISGTITLLEAMRAAGIQDLLFASSSSVYGNTTTVPFREDAWVDHPISPYAATKKAGELITHTYAHLHRMRIAALRFFTVYGPRQRPDLAIAKFTALLQQNEEIPVYGDGTTRRDYTYVDDTVRGVVAALRWVQEQQPGTWDVFNLGENHTVSLSELIGLLEDALGVSAVYDRQPMQPGDVEQTWADISKSQQALQYHPVTPIAEGIQRYVAWVKEQGVK